jgi:hypothetical protein
LRREGAKSGVGNVGFGGYLYLAGVIEDDNKRDRVIAKTLDT